MPDVTSPTRRGFLARTALTGLALSPSAPAARTPRSVIDCATHFYDTGRPQGVPWPSPKEPVLYRPSLPPRYLDAVKPFRVDGVVAIEASPWLEDNLWLLNLADRTPLIRAVVGHLEPGHPDFRAALDRFSKHPLWRGIRIGAGTLGGILDDPRMLADLRLLMEKNLSLDILVGKPDYPAITRLAGLLPDLRIMVGHLPLDDSAGIRACAAHRNIHAKVSGVVRRSGELPAAKLDELWDVFGPSRTVFASNWPTCDMIAPYPAVFRTIDGYLTRQPEDVRDRFYSANAAAFYRFAAPAAR